MGSSVSAALCAAEPGLDPAMGINGAPSRTRTFHLAQAVSSAEDAAPKPEGLRCCPSEARARQEFCMRRLQAAPSGREPEARRASVLPERSEG